MATSEHVSRVLLDATGPLAELHRRVLEAGCEVDPEWKLGIQELAVKCKVMVSFHLENMICMDRI